MSGTLAPRAAGAPEAARRALAAVDRVAAAMALASGALFIVLSLYITLDVLGRKFFHLSSAVTDEIGGYVLAFGGMWGLAHALRTGAHVRIDVLLPHLPRRLRTGLDYAAVALLGLVAAVLARYAWALTLESFATDARALSFMRTPLFVPQGLLAAGLSVLAVEALAILAVGLADSARARDLAPLEVGGTGGPSAEPGAAAMADPPASLAPGARDPAADPAPRPSATGRPAGVPRPGAAPPPPPSPARGPAPGD